MKNIHLIPTSVFNETPYQIWRKIDGGLWRPTKEFPINSNLNGKVNLYITNDEEIKEGQNYIGDGFSGKNKFKWHKSQVETYPNIKKDVIVLTTDQDLIKDGVQAIDDAFLEWFVKNPSCERVEVETTRERNGYHSKHKKRYKIIIPKEPKQREMFLMNANIVIDTRKPKQETLEEAAERLSKDAYKKHSVKDNNLSLDEQIQRSGGFIVGFKEGMNEGAKWQAERMGLMEIELNHTKTLLTSCEKALEDRDKQAERMYSEEEVRTAIFTSFLLGVDRGFYSKEIEDKIIQKLKKK